MTRLVLVLFVAGCGGETKKDPCAGVDCGNGECVADSVAAHCACDEGYVAVRLTCVPEDEADPDIDGDGIPNEEDVCPAYPDPDQDDGDTDGTGDLCENRAIPGSPEAGTVATWLRSGRVVYTGIRSGTDTLLEGRTYDPTTDAIDTVVNAPQHHHGGGAAVTLLDGRALFIGGEGDGAQSTLCDFFEEGVGFSPAPSTAEARTFFGWTLLSDGRVFVSGGILEDGWTIATEIFDGAWQPGPALEGVGIGANAVIELADGRVLITGGFSTCDGASPPSVAAMIWDPSSDEVVQAEGTLLEPRWGHSMARLPDGRVVIVGGAGAPCGSEPILPVDTIEVYDPETETFSLLAEGTPHLTAAVVPLADGSVLALGGVDEGFDATDAASRITADGLATDPPFEAEPLLTPRSLFISGAVLLFDGSVFAGPSRLSETTFSNAVERIYPYYDVVIDGDSDGVVDVRDDCPDDANADQADGNGNGIGDACE